MEPLVKRKQYSAISYYFSSFRSVLKHGQFLLFREDERPIENNRHIEADLSYSVPDLLTFIDLPICII
jgi:hypothetical protein